MESSVDNVAGMHDVDKHSVVNDWNKICYMVIKISGLLRIIRNSLRKIIVYADLAVMN